jgi:transcriptional regulator with XRE-family HTH domain
MTKDGVAQLEQGRRMPAWETVLAPSEALGVSCEEFRKEPRERRAPQRGQPRKEQPEPPAAQPKRSRGRPRREK